MGALARAAEIGAAALFIHTHPADRPLPSERDAAVDADLRSVFEIRTGTDLYGSLVLSRESSSLAFTGRVWLQNRALPMAVDLLREVGDRIRFSGAADAADPGPPPAVFDRQVLAFGPAFQGVMGSLNIGVVGLGGTGSAICEQLARLGVGTVTVVDDDVVTATNITRIYGSRSDDIGRKKVDVTAEHISGIGLGTLVRKIDARTQARTTIDALRACDVIFGCTDDHTGRVDLARLTTWCLIPVLDLGVRIEANAGMVEGIWCRVTVQVPGSPCVVCWNVVDQNRMRMEQLPTEELEALRGEGYAPDLDTRDPAVIPYTTLTASLAINELISRIAGLAPSPAQQILARVDGREIRVASRAMNPAHWCAVPSNIGLGTSEPLLGRHAWT
jgi:hypothetical protein